jgi:cellulose synthase/poly-beta-1,6-N-acetylglucosamine synthase-like glycosyltransferase
MVQVSILALAVAMVAFATPLFLNLALCIVGNLFRVRRPNGEVRREVHLALVVPAHDEELMIARTVESVRAADRAIPIYVVAHNCSDSTASRAAEAGAQVLELNNPKLRGKGAALRHGFAAALAAGANAVLVVDADSVVSANLISATQEALANGAQATQCRYELELPAYRPGANSLHPLARLRVLAFRGMNVLRARGRAGLGFSTGLFGNGFALTAATLDRVPFSANSIAEDVEYSTKLIATGVRVCWVGEAFVHAHIPATGAAQATQEARWEGGRFRVASQASGRLFAAVFGGNWRALETLADVWSLPLSRGILALLLTAALPVHWLHVFAIACAAIAILYVLQSALLGDEPAQDLAALVAAPLYLLWKAAITPLVVRQSRSRAAWARTKREVHQP